MTRKQIISLVSAKAHLTKKAAKEAVDTFLEEIVKALKKGERVVLSGFGAFRIVKVKDKPMMGKIIKAHRVPRFSPGKPLKKEVK